MSWDGPERRHHQRPFDGKERRYVRRMSEAEIQAEVHELRERVERIEENADRLDKLPDAVAKLAGTVEVLTEIITGRFDKVDEHVQEATGVKTAITFASVVIVPIILALIGGYIALKTGTTDR